jgi:adenine-specific DNA-methyltransferase
MFVSIDDHEVYNLRMILNEIFGEENFLAAFVRKRRMATGMRDEPVSPDHEYVVAYAKSIERVRLFGGLLDESSYPFEDAQGKYRSTDLTVGMTKEMRPNQHYALRNPKVRKEYWPPEGRVWRFQPSTMEDHVRADNIIWPEDHPGSKLTRPRFKTRFQKGNEKTKPVSTWIETQEPDEVDSETNILVAGMNLEGTKELRDLLGAQVVEYPKPVSLLRALVTLGAGPDDIVLDFFAGSATTGHAVLDLNREDGSSRRFIMVQLPEPTAEDSTARQAGFSTISDIGKERLRRVIARLQGENEGKLGLETRSFPEDLGFRVFKLAPSAYRPWRGSESTDPDAYAEQMVVFADPLVEGWKPEDVMWEVAIKEGYSLSSRVERALSSKENTVWRVHDPDTGQSLLVCLDSKVSTATIKSLGLNKEALFVCRDSALDDELAANLALQCRLKTV